MTIRIFNPSLDDVVVDGNPCLRGVIDPKSLSSLRIDLAYQREFLSPRTRRFIIDALVKNQRLPDIEIGMRGEDWDLDDQNNAILESHCFIIDGQQRVGTIGEFLLKEPNLDPRLGAVVHFNTRMEWERERFHALGLHRANIATSIIMRNARSTCPGVATLYGLSTTDKTFPLYNRVCWSQSMGKSDLISAVTYIHFVCTLHGHLGPGIATTNVNDMINGLDRLEKIISLRQIRANTKLFWDTIEVCWGVRDLSQRGATWMRNNFLHALIDLFSDYLDFWDGPVFKVPVERRNKLERFPISDPEIKNLASMTGKARESMLFQLASHMNKGLKEENKLLPRDLANLRFEHRSRTVKDRWAKRRQEMTQANPS